MAPGNDATFLWRHAADRRFGAAVDNTRRCRHPIPASPFRPLPFPRFACVRGTPMVSLGCGHRRATERPKLYQRQPLNLPIGGPRRRLQPIRLSARFEDLGLVSSPNAHNRCENTNEAFDLPTTRGPEEVFRAFGLYGRWLRERRRPFQLSLRPPVVGSVVGGLRS